MLIIDPFAGKVAVKRRCSMVDEREVLDIVCHSKFIGNDI
jgi:hypothetical protein